MTKVGAYFPSEYLKPDVDLWNDVTKSYREVTAVITGVTARTFKSQDKGKDDDTKPVMWFKGTTKGLIMNKTMMEAAAEFLGSDDDENWRGQRITLFVTKVEAFGGNHDVIRVKAAVKGLGNAAVPAPVPVAVAAPTMDDAADTFFPSSEAPAPFDPDEIPF